MEEGDRSQNGVCGDERHLCCQFFKVVKERKI